MTGSTSHGTSSETDRRGVAVEWLLIALISLVALGLRAAHPSRLAVEHFDEGVYASNIFFDDVKGRGHYPDQHLYAPPLLPFLIELSMVALGPSNFAPMLVNIIAGALTVPLVWWVARRWFGGIAGVASATLVATSDVHILFSRTALTDVLLCFWLLAAVYFFWEALTRGSRLALFAAGITTGIAWWTKYSGWLPLAIGLAALVPWRLFGPVDGTDSAKGRLRLSAGSLAMWGTMALLAFLVWAPWLWALQSKGGYSAVQANHRGYLLGPSQWFQSLFAQEAKLRTLDGWLSAYAPLLAVAVALGYEVLTRRRSTWNVLFENRVLIVLAPAACALGLAWSASAVLGLAGALGIAWTFLPGSLGRPAEDENCSLARWLLTAWFVGLLCTTPLYLPYPRLTLPWLMSAWLGAGLLLQRAVSRARQAAAGNVLTCGAGIPRATGQARRPHHNSAPAKEPDHPVTPSAARSDRAAALTAVAIAVVGIGGLSPFAMGRGIPGWEPRTGLADVAPRIVADLAQDAGGRKASANLDGFIVYTFSEPALLFQLRLAEVRWVQPVKDLGFVGPDAPRRRLPTYVAYGRQAEETPWFLEERLRKLDHLRRVGSATISWSRLVRLDEPFTPAPAENEPALEWVAAQ